MFSIVAEKYKVYGSWKKQFYKKHLIDSWVPDWPTNQKGSVQVPGYEHLVDCVSTVVIINSFMHQEASVHYPHQTRGLNIQN